MRNGEKSMPGFLEGKWLIAKNMIKVNEVRFVHKTQVTVLLIITVKIWQSFQPD